MKRRPSPVFTLREIFGSGSVSPFHSLKKLPAQKSGGRYKGKPHREIGFVEASPFPGYPFAKIHPS